MSISKLITLTQTNNRMSFAHKQTPFQLKITVFKSQIERYMKIMWLGKIIQN